MILTLTILLCLFLALGMPIAFSMGLAAAGALALDGTVPLIVVPQKFYSSLDSFPLLAIPLFILAGAVMNVGGITEILIRLSQALVGHVRGGLGQVTVFTSLLFATISGSAAAGAAAVGGMLIPAMERDGYRREDAAVITAAAAILGPIVPPSILMVIYGSMTGLSIGTLFLAGVGPGLLITVILMITVYRMAGRMNVRLYPRSSLPQIASAFRQSLPALVMPAIIVGGIVSGVFTATEAGAIAVAYGIAYALVTRRAGLKTFMANVTRAAVASSSIMVILGGAALFGWIIARAGVPAMLAAYLQGLTDSSAVVMFLILVVLLVVGIFIEPIPALIMLVPVLQPIAQAYGFDPYHFATVVTYAVLLGSLSPPVAVLVLITCKIANIDYTRTTRPLLPVFAMLVSALFIIAFVPAITLAVPRLTGS
ncbi:MAG TPA: TRAP transporter large permease [Hyphomicrobiaceae bacterium]